MKSRLPAVETGPPFSLVEAPHPPVLGRGKKKRVAGRRDGPAVILGPGGGDSPGRQLLELTQRDVPEGVAGVQVDRRERAPRRGDGRISPAVHPPVVSVELVRNAGRRARRLGEAGGRG